ncbi:ShlB/FhaC/HecB family hemolysin secretion/activation protein [Pannonibacter sp. I15F10I1]|uniref:ShlB/FhaC/HecB family hemolysin secretion/activation protein n=1 Tax=Pannonibacter sp. I15F10I1 TaxID=2003580 RepID=UPI001FCB6D01|nr:ShlB/FhaC/HecB family hemolysin secretion/activation protein [Pannonibacter sp. I15F10I1]
MTIWGTLTERCAGRRGVARPLAAAALVAAMGGAGMPAAAQDAGSLLREQQRRLDMQRPLPGMDAEAAAQSPQGRPVTASDEGQTILVTGLRFTGRADLLPPASQAAIIAAGKGKRLGIGGIQALASQTTAALQAQGHLLASAILPPQDITEGVITIEIRQGRLEEASFERAEGMRASEARLRAILEQETAGEDLTQAQLESALLRMNAHPGVTARARLMPGAAPGTTRLVIDTTQDPLLSGSLSADNFGSWSTGRIQGTGTALLTDATGYGDLSRVTLSGSEGQRFGSLSASVPLWASPFTLSASYGHLTYRNVDDTGRLLGLKGKADFAGATLDYALMTTRRLSVSTSAGVNWKSLVDDSRAGRLSDKQSVSGTFGVSGEARDAFLGGGLTALSLSWTTGTVDLSGEPSAEAADRAGLRTAGAFNKVNASAARVQKLQGAFSLFARGYGQLADGNLDSSEEFSLGGPYAVRAYPVGEGRGDMGVLGSVELRYDLPVDARYGNVQLAAFADAGQVVVNRFERGIPLANACACNSYGLGGAGLYARWTRENLNISATWAHAIGDNPGRSPADGSNTDGKSLNNQFWLTGAIRF